MMPLSPEQDVKDLLIEIGCEELPAKLLQKIRDGFLENISHALRDAGLHFKSLQGFITPRRLAVRALALSTHQPSGIITKRGPSKNAAFDEQGNPTKAARAFAESCGVSIDRLALQDTPKGAWLTFEHTAPGKTTQDLLPTIITNALNDLAMGRRMRWGNTDYHFFRPIHWIVLLFGNQAIKTEILGVKTGNLTRGHRFHHPQAIAIPSPTEYETVLENQGFVIADYAKRRDTIRVKMLEITAPHHRPIIIDELLDEVTGLVEWPVVLLGKFETSFLNIPREVLITSLQIHQKCFTVSGNDNALLPQFIIISNLESKDPKAVIAGNEWVIRARLEDAVFYYEADRKTPLETRQTALDSVIFQAGLGSLGDKSRRIAHIAYDIARKIQADLDDAERADLLRNTERAAFLCKTDLLTQMVGEFPELQGVMGRYYALHDGEPLEVAQAIEEHYYPRFSQDTLPATRAGLALALADRLDTVVGLFGIGKRPTGDKDPFGLRRQALGIVRILIEKQLDLDLAELISRASSICNLGPIADYSFLQSSEKHVNQLLKHPLDLSVLLPGLNREIVYFCFDRLRAYYQDQGLPPQIFEAVFEKNPTNPYDFDKRIQALKHFLSLKEADSLTTANKRVKNILFKDKKGWRTAAILTILGPNFDNPLKIDDKFPIDEALLKEEAEKTLALHISQKEVEISPLLERGDYTNALISLAMLQTSIDQFFTDVMVMVDDQNLKNNRLNLLSRIWILFSKIADISLL